MRVASGAVLPPFTGKVVKTLLVNAEPGLNKIFLSAYSPKPIAISTLAKLSGSKYLFLWKKGGRGSVLRVCAGDVVEFWIGFSEDIAPTILGALEDMDGVEAFNTKWFLLELEVESYRLPARSDDIPSTYRLDNADAIKIEFRTPALLLDPYKKSRFKRFLPVPGNVFSYNIGELLRIQRNKDYIEVVNLVNALLNETYNILETVKPVKYVYGGKELPGIIGYAKYMIDWELLTETKAKELLENLLLHSAIMGIGTSRASGFGYITVKILRRKQSTT